MQGWWWDTVNEEKILARHTLRGILYEFLKGKEVDLLYGKQLQMCEGPNILRSGR